MKYIKTIFLGIAYNKKSIFIAFICSPYTAIVNIFPLKLY